jgi:asparagine synthase (glutamine-hydrolysing)
MCGIAGIFDPQHTLGSARSEIVQRMTRTLIHRGPDDEGFFIDEGISLGHRRLSIIDLETGRQPMGNEDGSLQVIFNGEIYNYRDLHAELEAKGHVFRTRSDTETIVHGYEEWGVDCVERFRGMFALAVWDAGRQRLFIARDRLGKKPLYYAVIGELLLFASEIKAILQFPGLDRTLDLQALSDYVSLGYVPGEKSIFRQIRKLSPGHWLTANRDGVRVRRYWDVRFEGDATLCDGAAAQLAALLSEAVVMRMRSDVPLGAFLSGGIDSSAVVAFMTAAQPSPVITASIGFSDRDFDELEYARLVAGHFRTEHHEEVVTPDTVRVLDALAWHYDEPFGDSSAVPTYEVSRLARRHVTVALSGDGGDESFAGYRRYYFDVRENRVRSLVPAPLRRVVFGLIGALYPKADFLPQVFRGKAFLSNVARTPWEAYLESVSNIGEADTQRVLSADVRRALGGYRTASLFEQLYHAAGAPDPLSRIQYIDFKTYLPDDILVKVDRASMAHSLEVRCPLLDHRVVEYAAALPARIKLRGRQSKLILKQAVESIVPRAIIERPKMGFAMPVPAWLRQDLRGLIADYVLGTDRRHDLFDAPTLRRMWYQHERGLRDRTAELWGVLMFNLWYDRFARGPARET